MINPCVYILASRKNGALYIGVTSNLIQRIWQHREGLAEGFTKKYNVKTLVWYEQHATMESAIAREKALKKWNRTWKLRLIEKTNPQWLDLWQEITGATVTDQTHTATHSHTCEDHNTETQTHPRYSREGRNPEATTIHLDSRLRGSDEVDSKELDQGGSL